MARRVLDLQALRADLHQRVVVAAESTDLERQVIAQRAGVSCRTLRRLLAGETCGEGTLERVAGVLGVLESGQGVSGQEHHGASPGVKAHHVASRPQPELEPLRVPTPVLGAKAASRVLGVSESSIDRAVALRRPPATPKGAALWWPSADAVRAWWADARGAT